MKVKRSKKRVELDSLASELIVGVEPVNLMVSNFNNFFSPPPSSSHHDSLHLYQEAATAPELMADKPGRSNVVSTRLLFIPSLPAPTPPPWPGLSWQPVISPPNRLQT